jgi:hypothetical protein
MKQEKTKDAFRRRNGSVGKNLMQTFLFITILAAPVDRIRKILINYCKLFDTSILAISIN